jgi:hypothetical protein
MLCLKSVIEASSGVHFSHFQHTSHVRELTGCKQTDWFLTCTEKSVKVFEPFTVFGQMSHLYACIKIHGSLSLIMKWSLLLAGLTGQATKLKAPHTHAKSHCVA